VLVGCAVGATMPRLAAQSFPQNPSAQRWEQFCDLSSSQHINTVLSTRGVEGFELFSTNIDPAGGIFVCFKRPAAR